MIRKNFQPLQSRQRSCQIPKSRQDVYKRQAEIYGYDISEPATNAKEAVQWLYFGYLAAVKTQNGAAMSVGRVSTFLDIYIQRDLENGTITEKEAQELIDHFVKMCIRDRVRTGEVDLEALNDVE